MEKQFSYRIVKIGGKAVAVALTAFGLMAGSAQAAEVLLGSSLTALAPDDGTTRTGANYNPGDYWVVHYNPTASYGVATSRTGDIFYANTVTFSDSNLTAYNVYPWGSNPVTGTIGFLNDNNPYIGIDAQRTGTFVANAFGNIADGTDANNYHFGAGTTVSDAGRGEKAYAVGTYWTYGGNADGAYSITVYGGTAAGVTTSYAIDIDGDAIFYGNNTVNGDVSSAGNYIRGSNVVFNSGLIYGDINYETAATVYLNGAAQGGLDVTGSVNFGGHDGVLNLANNTAIFGDVTANSVANATVNFAGNGLVSGEVGPIKAINVQGNGSWVQLNTVSGNTQVGNLNITADQAVVEVNGQLSGNVNLNGHFSKLALVNRADETSAGMTGVLDFGMYKSNQSLVSPDTYGKGTLEVGNGVDVTFSNDPSEGIKLTNADNATVVFSGNSTVTGDLGSADSSLHNTPYKIYAGAGTSTVTFNGRVYVGEGNLNIGPSNSTVVLNAGLTGNLVFGTGTPESAEGTAYSSYGDGGIGGTWGDGGTVKLAHNQTITGSITTVTDGTGTMLFQGASAYANDIGASDYRLASVVFNSETAGSSAAPVSSTITGDVWANNVTIGNGSAHTKATMTAGDHVLGDSLTLAGANTTLVTDAAFNTTFTKDSATGMLSNATAARLTVDGGNVVTNGATMKFSIDTNNDGTTDQSSSSWIKTSGTGTLVMNSAEKVNLNLLGSLKNGASMTVIEAGVNASLNGPASSGTTDNSYVITTVATETSAGLVVTASRANDVYITKSGTAGHFSNAAAQRLGELGAAGKSGNYSSDMQVVFNKLDIDQWGYGNNEANLATQVKRLAPIANASAEQSALNTTTVALLTVGERLSVLRGDSKMAGTDGNGRQLGKDQTGWVKLLGGNYSAKSIDQYDGFKSTSTGLSAGTDTKIKNGVVGAMFSHAKTNITQQDFRSGDAGQMNSNTLAVYGTQEYGEAFVEGALARTQHNLTSNRLTAIDRVANANVDFGQTTLKLGAGYRIAIDGNRNSVLTPMVSLQADKLKQDGYTETGAGALSLRVDERSLNRTRASLGVRYNTSFERSGTTYFPEVSVAANRNNGMNNTDVVSSFAGDTSSTKFTTAGVVLPRTSYSLSAGVRFATSKTTEVQVGYRFEGGSGVAASTAQVRAAWAF